MIKNIRHTGIVVKDLKKSLHLYQDILGMEKFSEGNLNTDLVKKLYNVDSKLTYVKLKAIEDNNEHLFLLELIYYHKKNIEIPKTYNHIAFTIYNIQEVYWRLKENEVQVYSAPIKHNNVKLMFCRDYDGNLLELVEEIKKDNKFEPPTLGLSGGIK